MDGKWQTVGGAKKKEKKPQASASNLQVDRPAATDGTPSAFAALDASWRGRTGAAHQQQSGKAPGATPLTNGVGGAHGVDRHTDDGGSSEASLEHQQTPAKRKKPKPPKAKKPTPASAAAALKLDAVQKVISAAQQRYPADERVQLDTVADHFVNAFRDAELPFNKLLAEQPLPKVAKTPADVVPADITQTMSAFLSAKDAAAVAAFVGALTDAAFEGLPEAAGSSKAPPKANVGLLVSLALALRAKPAALLLGAERLAAGGRRYSAPGRLPLLLWLLSQAAQGSEAVALAVWVRVLLPQILGCIPGAAPSPAAAAPGSKGGGGASATQPQQPQQQPQQLSEASAAKAFQYLDGLLGSPAVKRDMRSGILVREGEPPVPLVPPALLVALLQAAHDRENPHGSTATLARSHQGILRTIALSGVPDGGFDGAELLRLSLDAAAAAPATDDPLVVECAHLVVEALEADDTAFAAWQTRHKGQLRGSSRVLAALQHSYPDALMPLLALPSKRTAFVELMPALRQRHQYALRTGKGWQGAAARAADQAALVLGAKMKRDGSSNAKRSALLTIAGGVGLSIVVRAVTAGAPSEHPLVQMVARASAAAGLTGALQQAAAVMRPYTQQAVDLTWPHLQPAVEAATPYVQQASATMQPVVQHVSDAASQASGYALAALKNVTAAWR